jgi:hypothetical protein
VLPIDISLQNLRITGQPHLSAKEYNELMMDKIDDALESRFKALEEIEKEKVMRTCLAFTHLQMKLHLI